MADTLHTDIYVDGYLSCQEFVPPAASIGNAAIMIKDSGGDPIDAEKVEQEIEWQYSQADGGSVTAVTMPIGIFNGDSGQIVAFEVSCLSAPYGGNLQMTVDLRKCNESSPTPATVLSSAVTYSSSQLDCEVEEGVISSPTLADGDQLVVVVAVSGSTGTQGQGLIVTTTIRKVIT